MPVASAQQCSQYAQPAAAVPAEEDVQELPEADLQKEWEKKEQWYTRAVSYWDQQVPLHQTVQLAHGGSVVLVNVLSCPVMGSSSPDCSVTREAT